MKTIVLLSGGMDSAVLLYKLLSEGQHVKAISYSYGQRHIRELDSARVLATGRGIEHSIVNLTELTGLFGASALTNHQTQIPLGHYAQDSMKATVVPNRNMIFMSIATAWAISTHYDNIAIAAHSGDHFIYHDCRPEFIEALSNAIELADERKIKLISPLVLKTKAEICGLGHELGVPFELTWSCYQDGQVQCGRCGTCTERREAFTLSGVKDPTKYMV